MYKHWMGIMYCTCINKTWESSLDTLLPDLTCFLPWAYVGGTVYVVFRERAPAVTRQHALKTAVVVHQSRPLILAVPIFTPLQLRPAPPPQTLHLHLFPQHPPHLPRQPHSLPVIQLISLPPPKHSPTPTLNLRLRLRPWNDVKVDMWDDLCRPRTYAKYEFKPSSNGLD